MWHKELGIGINRVEEHIAFDRSEMDILRKKLYTNSLLDSVYNLGRTVPRLTTLSVMALGYQRHITASVMYMFIQYMFFVEDKFCFYLQMAIKSNIEALVSVRRLQVRKEYWSNARLQNAHG